MQRITKCYGASQAARLNTKARPVEEGVYCEPSASARGLNLEMFTVRYLAHIRFCLQAQYIVYHIHSSHIHGSIYPCPSLLSTSGQFAESAGKKFGDIEAGTRCGDNTGGVVTGS